MQQVIKFSSCKWSKDNTGCVTVFVTSDIILKISPLDLLKLSHDIMAQTFKAMCIPDPLVNATQCETEIAPGPVDNSVNPCEQIPESEDNTSEINATEACEKNANLELTIEPSMSSMPDTGTTNPRSVPNWEGNDGGGLTVNTTPYKEIDFNALLKFIQTYVNENCPSNNFHIDELREFTEKDVEQESIITFLQEKNYDVIPHGDTLSITVGVAGNASESARSDRSDAEGGRPL